MTDKKTFGFPKGEVVLLTAAEGVGRTYFPFYVPYDQLPKTDEHVCPLCEAGIPLVKHDRILPR